METRKKLAGVVFLAGMLAVSLVIYAGGSLEPSAPPGPTMKTLDDVEPRTPVESLSGSATALHVIDQPGSYYLTGNLTGVDSKNGIVISANDVSLDLYGFAVIGGPNTLNGISVSSIPPGSWSRSNITVCNGTVRDWASYGVFAYYAQNSQFRDLQVSENGTHGLYSGFDCTVIRCTAYNNSQYGIIANCNNVVSECTAYENSGGGIYAYSSTVSNCTALSNSGWGIYASYDSTVTGCTVHNTTGIGIEACAGCTVNNCTVTFSNSHGIQVGSYCLVTNCNVRRNGRTVSDGAGIYVGVGETGNRIIGNNAGANDYGIHVQGDYNHIERNTASNNGTYGIWISGDQNFVVKNSAFYNPPMTSNGNFSITGSTNRYGQIVIPGVRIHRNQRLGKF